MKPADEEAAQYRSLEWRVTDRIDVHIIPSSQLFVPSRKYVHSLILQLVMCLTAKWEQSPGKKVTLPAELNWASVYMRKKMFISPSQELITVLADALIVLSIPSLPVWASQSCFMEKRYVARLGGWHGVAALTLGWFSNRTGTSVDDGVHKSNNWLDQWQSGKLDTGSRV